MKKIAKIFTFLILIFCGVVFASCGKGGAMPTISASETNFEIVIGTDESKTFDVTLSDYGNGSDSVRVESYEQNRIIDITTEKIRDGLTRVTVKPLYPGKATIKISSITHNAKPIEVTVNVILPVGDIEINKTLENKLYVIKGESVDFSSLDLINYMAISTGIEGLKNVQTNQIGVTYTLENVLVDDGVSIENGKLVVSEGCTLNEVEVRATSIYNSEITKTFKVKILNPITSAVYIDGSKVFENGLLVDGSGDSFAFELYPRESDVTMSQKDVLIYVKAGSEAESINIEKIFDETKYAVELKNLTYEDGMFKYAYTISALNAGYLEGISFKISYKDYTLGENGNDYFVKSGNLSVASYNLPNSVLVNGNSSTASGLDVLVFENIATIGKGTLLEFTLSPSNLAPEFETIRLWAENYNNCPVSFYKLNATRTSYELVFGYPRDAKDGDTFVCSGIDHNGNAYFDMPVGTKLYVVKNQKFNKTDNTNAVVYASSLNFYDLGLERSKIQLNIKVNPGASSVNRVNYDGTNFTIVNSNLIVSELVENFDIYLAIAPENFDLGTSSIVKLKNSNLADVSGLTVVGADEKYLYVKFTLSPKKLGSTKLTIYLCDGFEKEFDLKIISTLDDITIDVSKETESIVDYKENLTGNIGEDSYLVQKLAFKSGTSIQLTKTAYPFTAEYILEYSFYDLTTVKSISQLTISDIFENANFALTSDILNVDTLKNYSIIQAKTSQSAGKTLIKIDVKGRNADGDGYEEDASHTFYFIVEIYKGVDGFEISSNVHEIYSYETLGDRNAGKSKCEFSVTLQSRFGLPTYLNALELYYGTELVEFNDANRAVLKYEGKDIVVITRNLDGNVWTYSVQALTSDVQNLVFVLKLVEANESKVIGGVVRVVVKDAVEIEDIEIVNVDLNDGIYIENNNFEGDKKEATFEIKYNLYTKDGSEPLNTGLEFELSSNLIALGVKIDANGKITVPAGVGGNGKVLIYPSSNYFASSNGMQEGSKPFVTINIAIANGESEETAIRIDSQDKIEYLKKAPTKHYLLAGNFVLSETMGEFTGGIYGLFNGRNSTLNVTSTMFTKFAGIIKNVDFTGNISAKTENLGIIAYENYGTIENVNVSNFVINNTKTDSYVGVLVGKNFGSITGGEIVATVKGFCVGGVVGLNGKITENAETEDEKTYVGTISNVLFAGNISASNNAGGIAAENEGTIKNCKIEKWSNNKDAFISANENANGYFGAIAGVSSGEISQTYAYSYNDTMYDVSANANVKVGGLVGCVTGGVVSECMTNFSLEGEKVGALVGKVENGSVVNCYTLSKVSNASAFALAISGEDKISNSYSRAYYVENGENTYLKQAGGENVFVAGNYDTLTNFNLALQNNLKDENLWGYDASINNGSLYLVNANAPKVVDKINININETDSSKYMYSEKDGTINIVMYFYKVLESLSDGVAKSQLNNLNIISLEEIFGKNNNLLFNLAASSSISFVGNELRISGVGKTEVNVTSKYASTSCREQKIVFYVIYPIQDFNLYHGSSSMNPSTIIKNGDVDQVGYSKTETYASNVKATVLLNGANYSIFTNLFAIGFEIKSGEANANGILNGVGSIYNNKENSSFDDGYKFISEGTYTLSPSNYEFAVGEDERFTIKTILALQNNGLGTYLGNIKDSDFDIINELISKNFNKNYEVQVVRGASRIQTTLTDSELSPSNVLNFDVVAISDKKDENIIVEIYENDMLVGASNTSVEEAIFDVTAVKSTKIGNSHNFNVYVSVMSDIRKTISKVREFKIKISDSESKVVSTLNLTLIPQEVVSISQSHYAVDNTQSNGFTINTKPTTVLRPGKNGLLAINLYPDYAAYSKIEIESAVVNGEYYVLFEQMINSQNNDYINASGTIGYSSERDTNKLTIYHSEQLTKDNGMIYVRTKIVDTVKEGVYFPITIKVYPADPTKEVKTTTIVLSAETINKAQITVDGKKDAVISRGNYVDFEVAVNEDQELRDIRCVDHEQSELGGDYINIVYNTAEYEIRDGKKIYSGRIRAGLNAEINGDGKVVIQTIMRKMINGKSEEEIDSITLSIVDFTVDGMYIEGNAEDNNVFVAPIQLRQDLTFGFKLSSTPAYNSTSPDEEKAADRIAKNKEFFLKNIALNINYDSNYKNVDYNYLYTFNKDKLTFSNNTIEQTGEGENKQNINGYSFDLSTNEEKANLAYNLYYKNSDTSYFDENGVKNTNNYFDVIVDKDENDKPLSSKTFSVNGLRSGNIPMQIKIAYTLPGDHNVIKYFTYDFTIKVQIYEDEDTPIAIKTEEEFIRYMNSTTTESGEPANYILMNDLYLTDFTPIANTDMIASLDGNNKIITIRNFNISSMLNNNSNQTLNLALFQNVGENTTLKNLTINLYELEDIIINEDLVSNANIAGLFIENYGIIYNCEVTALNLAKAYNTDVLKKAGISSSSVDQDLNKQYRFASHSDGNGIRVYFSAENHGKLKKDSTTVQIAGLGITNFAAGRITNSRVGNTTFTKVFMTDIAQNKSADYSFAAEHLTLLGQADIAGVVLRNGGVIASSFFSNGYITNLAVSGTASKTAGFAIYNEFGGIITGSYVKSFKKATEINSKYYTDGGIYAEGISAGFVYENSSVISDCYANLLLGGSLSGRLVSGFVYSNTTTGEVERCYSAATITGKLTTRMPFSGNNARGDSMQLGKFTNCYYYVQNYDTETLLEEKYSTGAYAILASLVDSDLLYGFAYTSDSKELIGSAVDGVWRYVNGEITLTSANEIAISVRYLIENYNGQEGARRFPYVSGYEYGSSKNPIIIRTADEFNRAFGQETGLKENAYYAISQKYNKNDGTVFGNYRLISHIDFNNLQNIAATKVASSLMTLTGKSTAQGGIFDGNGLTISNVEIALSEHTSVGLFSQIVSGAVFKNVNLTVKQVSAGNGVTVGGVAGLVYSSSLINIDLQATNLKGENRSEINGVNVIGGIVGVVQGDSKLSNLSSSISVISNYRGDSEYKRSQTEFSDLSYAGGIAGIIDIFKSAGESTVSVSTAQVNKLAVSGESIIVEAFYVGGVVGYVGESTKISDVRFEISGSANFDQKINSTGSTAGGIVGVNKGDLSEIRIEHEDDIQKQIEDSIAGYNKNGSSRYGNTTLFGDVITTNDVKVQYVGGLVGQMISGNLLNSYAKVDVSLSSAEYAGGLIGYNNSNGIFDQVYALGDVDGSTAGGLIGLNEGSTTIKHAVAINFYSKQNSNLLEALEQVSNSNSFDLSKAKKEIDGNNLILITNFGNLNVKYTFNPQVRENALSISTVKPFGNNSLIIIKINNEFFIKTSTGISDNWTINTDSNYEKSYNQDGNTLYVKDGRLYKTYNAANNKLSNEITNFAPTYYLESISISENGVDILTATARQNQLDANGNIISFNVNNIGSLVGKKLTELRIGVEVFANTSFTFNNVKLILNNNNINNNVKDLIKNLDNYGGVAADGALLNRMFLAANDAWDANMWAKDSDDMLPYLIFGVVSKVLYIEKPKDFERLWKYSGEGYVVIIGDDPATAFNPYKYDPKDSSTFGEFTSADLAGLSVGQNELYFNLSGIQETFVPSEFKATLYGEREGVKYYINGLTEKSLFSNVNGGVIRNIAFGYEDETKQNSNVHATTLLADNITSNALIENITVKKISLNIKTSGGNVGVLANTIDGIENLKDIHFVNVNFILESENDNSQVNAGMLSGEMSAVDAIENITFTNSKINIQGAKYNQVLVGYLAGHLTNATSLITKSEVTVTDSSISINSDMANDVYVGGYFGKSDTSTTINNTDKAYDGIKNITIDFSGVQTGKVYTGLMFGKGQNIVIQSGMNLTGEIKNGSNYACAYVGGLAGEANGEFRNITINAIDKNLINVKIQSNSTFISSIGGLIGHTSDSTTITDQININGNILVNNSIENSGFVAVGGVIGSSGARLTINATLTVGSETTNNKIEVNSGVNDNYTGGVVGYINQNAATISGTVHVYTNINVIGKKLSAGGIVGYVDVANADAVAGKGTIVAIGNSEGDEQNFTFNGDIDATITTGGDNNVYLGGIVGYLIGANSKDSKEYTKVENGVNTVLSNQSKIDKASFKGGAIYIHKGNSTAITIPSLNVGGLVGYMNHTFISGGCVSGGIQIDLGNDTDDTEVTITNANIGGVVGSVNGGEKENNKTDYVGVIGTKSWGNIKLGNNMNVEELYIGGVVGIATIGTWWRFGGNRTLTSIYNTNLGTNNKADNIRALVGSAPDVVNSGNNGISTGEVDNTLDNSYSHMFNLAVDKEDFGSNSSTLNSSDAFIVNNKDLFGEYLITGSKLKPENINSSSQFGTNEAFNIKNMKYYIANGDISLKNALIYANAHLIGNGKKWEVSTDGKSGSPIKTNDGYVSGFKFILKSKYVLNNGNSLENAAPNGIANINNGIIFANSVEVFNKDYSYEESHQTNSINSGVVGTNNGLISDTGAILQIKNALAGFVFENNGTILNSYVNGVVHNGAMYSFNGAKDNAGYISNCYTTIRQGGVIDSATGATPIFNGTLNDVYYDRNGVETEQTGATKKTTNAMSAYNDSNTNADFVKSINNIITRFGSNYEYNFGYPMLNAGAYKDCGYLKVSTKNKVPNVGKLEQIQSGNISYVEIITNLDYQTSGIGSHTQITGITTFEGNNYSINNIPGNTNGGFFGNVGITETRKEHIANGSRWTGNSWVEWSVNDYKYKFYYNEWSQESDNYVLHQTLVISTGTKEEGTTIASWDNGTRYGKKYSWTIGNDYFSLYPGADSYYFIKGYYSQVNITENSYIQNIEFNYAKNSTVGSDSLATVGAVANNFAGTLENVRSSGATVKGKTYVGGLVGYMMNSSVSGCFNFNDVSVTKPSNNYLIAIGGLVGYAEATDFGTTNRNGNYGNVSAGGQISNAFDIKAYVGGIVGYANKMIKNMIENSFNIGKISNEIYKTYDTVKAFAGGIIGGNSFGTINETAVLAFLLTRTGSNKPEEMLRNLYNYGQVYSANIAGGIIGNLEICNAENVFNFGQVVVNGGSDAFAGGIAGVISVFNCTIKNSGNEGPVSGTGARWVGVGGIVGGGVVDLNEVGGCNDSKKITGTIKGCYNSGELYCSNTSNQDGYVGGIAGGNISSIDGCSMTGTIKISDDETFGWIMGSAWDGASITNCYAEPSTVVVENKGTLPNGVNENGHNGTQAENNPGPKFYLDYQGGISVSEFVNFTKEVFRSKKSYGKQPYDKWKFSFTLSLKMLGNNGTTNDGSNVVYIKRTESITDLSLSYRENHEKPVFTISNYYGYVHVSYPQAFLTLNSGYYQIGQVKSWKWLDETVNLSNNRLSDGLTKNANLTSTSANDASMLQSTLFENAHALDWTNQVSEDNQPKYNNGIVEIENAEQLAYVSKNASDYAYDSIKLINDIDLTGYIWTPIGGGSAEVQFNNKNWQKSEYNGTRIFRGDTAVGEVTFEHSGWNSGSSQGYMASFKITLNGKEIFTVSGVRNGAYTGSFKDGDTTWEINASGDACSFIVKGPALVNFEGSFDGNGYTISGMAAYHWGYAGLFANIDSRNAGTNFNEFKNVRIVNSVVQSHKWAGTIAGQLAGASCPTIIYNNIIQANVYSSMTNGAASVIGRMGFIEKDENRNPIYKGLIVGNAVNSNQEKYASSDSGYLDSGNTSPTIFMKTNTQEYDCLFYTLFFHIPVGLKWRSKASLNEQVISGSIIYNNSGFTTASFTKFDGRVFISGDNGSTTLNSYEFYSSYEPGGYTGTNPSIGDLKWDEYTWAFNISVSGKPNKITGFVGENNKFSYSYNGSNSSTDINRYDQNSKYFNSNYDFELKVYDGDRLIKTLKYVYGIEYSFANDIKPYALSGNAITGYKIKGTSSVFTKDELTYSDFSTHAANKVVEIEIVRGDSEITFNVGNDENVSKTYSYTSDGGNGWIFTDENENQVGWYTPAGRTGYWVNAKGETFTKDNITEESGSFILYWIDDSSGEGKYGMSTYFFKVTLKPSEDASEDACESKYVLQGENLILDSSDVPAASGGKVFAGWSDGTNTYQTGETIHVTSDMTLTAQFVERSYILTFNKGDDGATGEMADQTITATEYTLPECEFTAPAGKYFSGWRISGKTYNEGETDAAGSKITLSDNFLKDGKITITANWEDIEHDVTINIPIKDVTIVNSGNEITSTTHTYKNVEYVINYIDGCLRISYKYLLDTNQESANYNKSISQEINVATINAVLKVAGVKVNGNEIELSDFTNFVVLGNVFGTSDETLGQTVGSTFTSIPAGKTGSIVLGYYGTVSGTTIAENDYFRTVTYTYKGVVVASQKILKGYLMEASEVLSVITRAGYVDYVVDKDTAVVELNKEAGTYAVDLTPINYTVTIDGNNATSGKVTGGTFNIETSFTVPENSFKKTGYKFVGWNTSADGTGDAFNAGDKIEYSKYQNNLTLYAQWTKIVLTLKFDKGAHGIGADSLYEEITLRFGESYTLPENRFTSNWYYQFTKWECNGFEYEVGNTFEFDNNLENDATYTFTAQWIERDLTIKFNSGNSNATGTMADVEFKYNDYNDGKYKLPENGFARLGFEFAGWSYTLVYEDTSGQYQTTRVGQTGEELKLDNLFARVEDGNIKFVYEITLTATWSAKYTFVLKVNPNSDAFSGIQLESNDSITITLPSESLEAGYTIVNPGYEVTSGDYTFAGYSLTEGGTTADFEVGTEIDLSTFFNSDGTIKAEYASCLEGNTFTLNLYSVWAK